MKPYFPQETRFYCQLFSLYNDVVLIKPAVVLRQFIVKCKVIEDFIESRFPGSGLDINKIVCFGYNGINSAVAASKCQLRMKVVISGERIIFSGIIYGYEYKKHEQD